MILQKLKSITFDQWIKVIQTVVLIFICTELADLNNGISVSGSIRTKGEISVHQTPKTWPFEIEIIK